jgi:[ribosomal protein S5]-alanine N-acetyltransferase
VRRSKINFIDGKKICLRQYELKDLDTWYNWFNDAQVVKLMDQRRWPNTKEKQKQYLERMSVSSSDIQLAIVYKLNDTLIGTVGLHGIDAINRNADVSIIIGDKKYWGKGLAKEAIGLLVRHAFGMVNLHKLTAGFISANTASRKLFESFGFKQEALLCEQVYLDGKYYDIIRMGLLKRNYALL